jgi:hypothetical protein
MKRELNKWQLIFSVNRDYFNRSSDGWYLVQIGVVKLTKIPLPGGSFRHETNYRGVWTRVYIWFPVIFDQWR